MSRTRHPPEQIIGKLREVELELAKGQTPEEAPERLVYAMIFRGGDE